MERAEQNTTPQANRAEEAVAAEQALRSNAANVLGDCSASYCKFNGQGEVGDCSYSCHDDVYDML